MRLGPVPPSLSIQKRIGPVANGPVLRIVKILVSECPAGNAMMMKGRFSS
jgi:hypothetical protein